jgi:hypothetical protein
MTKILHARGPNPSKSDVASNFVLGVTWSATLREERRLEMLEKEAVKRVFEHRRDGVIGGL